jgi:aspartate 1-decarboxylase
MCRSDTESALLHWWCYFIDLWTTNNIENIKITTEPLAYDGSGVFDNEICGKKPLHLNEEICIEYKAMYTVKFYIVADCSSQFFCF